MRNVKSGVASLVVGLLMMTGAQASFASVFNPETATLENGMQVVVVTNSRVPVVHHAVWYKAGAADEPWGQSGIAHYLEHLMFKGTDKFPDSTFSQQVSLNGGRENAFTSWDYTGYFQIMAKEHLAMVMEMEADRMTGLTLTPEVIEPERLVVLEERAQRTDNRPASQMYEHLMASLYMNHPYGTPIIGWEHEIKDLSLKDLDAFYRQWYAPNNAILVVAGDVTMADVLPLAEKYYGAIPAVEPIERNRPSEPLHRADVRVIKEDPRVRQPSFTRIYLAPSYARPFDGSSDNDPYALQVFDQILSGGATSRLYKKFVVEDKIAVSTGSRYDSGYLDLASFGFFASPAPGTSMEDLESALVTEIDRILETGVTQEEVDRAKRIMVRDAIFARDSLSAGARVLGSALAAGQTVADVESWPERIEAVTLDDVMRAARHVLQDRSSVTGVLLNAEG